MLDTAESEMVKCDMVSSLAERAPISRYDAAKYIVGLSVLSNAQWVGFIVICRKWSPFRTVLAQARRARMTSASSQSPIASPLMKNLDNKMDRFHHYVINWTSKVLSSHTVDRLLRSVGESPQTFAPVLIEATVAYYLLFPVLLGPLNGLLLYKFWPPEKNKE
eukprot:GEMP01044806.1.p1 GENE.GEMP01044806.1~~GEMP01044806.1.p1  ORF type:complete len:163 (+),score=23.60 GEMP01044806.1:209-697(+)